MYNIITLFKNYTPTFFTFRNFYKSVWDVKHFIYIVGYGDKTNYNYLYNEYINKCGTNIISEIKINDQHCPIFFKNIKVITLKDNEGILSSFILYNTLDVGANNDWDLIKKLSYQIFFKFLYKKKKKYISVDDDEFLYSSNMPRLKEIINRKNKYHFHFIEIIPSDNIKQLQWCFQSWYSHCLDGNKNPKNYSHGACKTYYFDAPPAKITGFWHHGRNKEANGDSCLLLNNIYENGKIKDYKENYPNLIEEGVCFHLTALTKKNLIETKLKNRYSNSGNYTNYIKNYENTTNWYGTIIDNTLLKYIDERDLKLLKE